MKKLNRKKKLLLVLTAAVAAAALGIGAFALLSSGGEPVGVYPFEYLGMTEFWGDSQESYGPVSTDKIQTVFLSETQTVTEVLVKAGDMVKKGDKLLSFDTTLDGLALERQRLAAEKVRLQLEDVQAELARVNEMQPSESIYYPIPEETEPDLGEELKKEYQISKDYRYDGSSEEKALICWLRDTDAIDAGILNALWQRAVEYQNRSSEKQLSRASALPGILDILGDLVGEDAAPETTEATEESRPGETTEATESTTETTEVTEPTTETTAPEETVPEFYVIIKVSEDNMSLGAILTWQGIHVQRDEKGNFSFRFFDAMGVEDHTVEREEEEYVEPDYEYGITYTAEELARMRAELRKEIKELEFDLKMALAEYRIMERELSDGHIYSEIDGEVVSLLTEEEARQSMQPLIKVSGGGGFYIEGSVSELEKDNLKIGQEVTVNDWNTGMTYTGEVTSLGEFPTGEDSWNGMGNPNTSYFPFLVFVDGSADLQAGRYVNMTYSTSEGGNGIYLDNAFVRTEKGESYVYVLGSNGKLEKRMVQTGKSLWGSYTQILSGITEEDLIAFPYGKNVKHGAPAEEQDISTLYQY